MIHIAKDHAAYTGETTTYYYGCNEVDPEGNWMFTEEEGGSVIKISLPPEYMSNPACGLIYGMAAVIRQKENELNRVIDMMRGRR